jgi:ribokinase
LPPHPPGFAYSVDHQLSSTQSFSPHGFAKITTAAKLDLEVNDVEEACELLLEAGARCVIVKEGAWGSTLFTEQERVEVPAFTVATDFTVGAGDSFNAGFLVAVEQEMEPRQALRFANAVAALVVEAKNGVPGAPTLDQVTELLRSN